jgi:HKD family nuclease
MTGFIHETSLATTTLSEITKVRDALSADRIFGCFAYATQSGFRAFELGVGKHFWKNTKSRWLFGIDYGRTDPRALREIAKCANSDVRIYDGRYVVDRDGFLPRRDFHPKVMLVENAASGAQGLVLGSGNFSYNGLQRSIEAGWTTVATTKPEIDRHILPVSSSFEALWKAACPLVDIIDPYETRLAALISSRDAKRVVKLKGQQSAFWIEAGHVTKNRGAGRPGNQIFAPNGFRHFFGLTKAKSGSTLMGTITFETSVGPKITKNYRENDNGMEKLALPTPEQHGFGVYDGKVLVFQPHGNGFLTSAIEFDEFEAVYGHRLANVQTMTGGRRFGELI